MSRTLLPLLLLAALAVAQDAKPHVAAAQERLQENDLAGALPHLDKAIEIEPDNVGLRVTRGRVHSGLEHYQEALADFDRAAELQPESDGILFFRGNAKQAMHDYDGAMEDFGKAFALNNGNVTALYRRAQVRELTNDRKGAIDDYTQLTILANQWGQPYLRRAVIKAQEGDAKGAEGDFEGAIYCMPDSVEPYLSRGRARLDLGDEKTAFEDFTRAVEMAPDTPDPYFTRGLAHHDVGRFAAALADLEKSIEIDPAEAREYARLYVCLCRMRLGKAEEGAKGLRAYLAEREKKDDWFTKVAGFLVGDLDEAAFLAAAETENEHEARERRCEACWYAGAKRLAAGDTAKAKELFEKCRGTDVWNFIEYDSATHALKRLAGG